MCVIKFFFFDLSNAAQARLFVYGSIKKQNIFYIKLKTDTNNIIEDFTLTLVLCFLLSNKISYMLISYYIGTYLVLYLRKPFIIHKNI